MDHHAGFSVHVIVYYVKHHNSPLLSGIHRTGIDANIANLRKIPAVLPW